MLKDILYFLYFPRYFKIKNDISPIKNGKHIIIEPFIIFILLFLIFKFIFILIFEEDIVTFFVWFLWYIAYDGIVLISIRLILFKQDIKKISNILYLYYSIKLYFLVFINVQAPIFHFNYAVIGYLHFFIALLIILIALKNYLDFSILKSILYSLIINSISILITVEFIVFVSTMLGYIF